MLEKENKMLRHELAKANKGLRHLSALKRKWEKEADRFYKSYWALRFAIHLTPEDRQKFQALTKYLMRHGEISLANFVADFQNKIERETRR